MAKEDLFDEIEFTDSTEDSVIELVDPSTTNESDDKDGKSSNTSNEGEGSPDSDDDEPVISLEADEDDEDEEDDDGEKSSSSPSSAEKSSSKSSPIIPFASALHEKGFLPDDAIKQIEEAEDKEEALFEAFEKTVEGEVQGWIDSLPNEIKNIVANYRDGVDLKSLLSIKEQQANLKDFTEENIKSSEETQIDVLKQFYEAKGFSSKKAERQISRLKDLGELEEEALDAAEELNSLLEAQEKEISEQAKKQQAEQAKQREETLKQIEKDVANTKEIIPGMKITPKQSKELMEYMTKPVKVVNGQPVSFAMQKRSENPVEFEKRLNYFIMQGFFDKDSKFDTVIKTAKTKGSSKLSEELERHYKGQTGSTTAKGGKSKTVWNNKNLF